VQRLYYNSRGQIDSTKDANFARTVKNTRAGTNGNLSEALYAGAGFARYTYDSYGRPVTIARSGAATDTIYYDIINRRDSVRNGVDTVALKFGYDHALLTSVTDSKGQTYAIAYNALAWPINHTDPAGAVDSLLYSLDGDLLRYVNRRHQATAFVYDSLHRLTSRVGDLSMSWAYQNHGRIQTATSGVSTETAYLSALESPDSIRTVMAGQAYWRRYRYTQAGQLDSTDVSGAGITFLGRRYLYDTKAILDTIRLNGVPSTLGVNNNLQVNSIAFSSGDVESRSYTTSHDLMVTSSSGLYNGFTQRGAGYNSAEQISEQINPDTVTGERYSYDLLGRLTTRSTGYYQTNNGWCLDPDYGTDGPCHSNSVWVTTAADTFTYDPAGNRTDHGATYVTGNRVTQFDGCSYTTDADGNVTSRTGGSCLRGTATFTWYAEGLLATITTGGSTIALNYDASGRLVRKDLNGSPQSYYLWDGNNLLAELDGVGTTKRAEYSYYPGVDRLHALIIGSTIYYAHSDAVGNVIGLSDTGQNLKRRYLFDAWGTMVFGSDDLPFNGYDRARWKGALLLVPELNLYYMRNRWYEGGTGRFLSEDPVPDAGANAYTYANDDPINASDPTGLMQAYTLPPIEVWGDPWPALGDLLSQAPDPNGIYNMGGGIVGPGQLAGPTAVRPDMTRVAPVAGSLASRITGGCGFLFLLCGHDVGEVLFPNNPIKPPPLDPVPEELPWGSSRVPRIGDNGIFEEELGEGAVLRIILTDIMADFAPLFLLPGWQQAVYPKGVPGA